MPKFPELSDWRSELSSKYRTSLVFSSGPPDPSKLIPQKQCSISELKSTKTTTRPCRPIATLKTNSRLAQNPTNHYLCPAFWPSYKNNTQNKHKVPNQSPKKKHPRPLPDSLIHLPFFLLKLFNITLFYQIQPIYFSQLIIFIFFIPRHQSIFIR